MFESRPSSILSISFNLANSIVYYISTEGRRLLLGLKAHAERPPTRSRMFNIRKGNPDLLSPPAKASG